MFEEQNQSFEMGRLEFAIDAVKWMRHGVRNLSALQVSLQCKNIVPDDYDVGVLLFGDAPDQNVNLAWVLGKVGCDLLADKRVRQIANLQTTVDRVVVGEGDEVHSALEQLPMQLARVGIRIRKIESAEKPFFRARAKARVNVEITFAHIY